MFTAVRSEETAGSVTEGIEQETLLCANSKDF